MLKAPFGINELNFGMGNLISIFSLDDNMYDNFFL